MIVELKVGGKLNLFTIFPIGATMQDRGKRKRSDDAIYIIYHQSLFFIICIDLNYYCHYY